MALISTPSIDQLKRAIAIQEKIEVLQADLAAILSQSGAGPAPARRGRKPKAVVEGSEDASAEAPTKRKKKRTMSLEAREKIAAAQRKRWAKQKKA